MKSIIICILLAISIYYYIVLKNEPKINKILKERYTNSSKTVELLESIKNSKAYYHIGKIYHEKSKGQEAIIYYKKAIEGGCNYALMDIADIYNWGLSDINEDKNKAREMYQKIVLYGDNYMKSQAEDKLKQISEDQVFRFLEENPITQVVETVEPFIDNIINVTDNVDNLDDNIANDPQNVHDHVVMRTTKKALNSLKQHVKLIRTNYDTKKQVTEYINKNKNPEKRKRALRIIDEIFDSKVYHNNTSEKEMLNLVWHRIHDDIHKDKQTNLKDNLVTQLAESIEHDKPVCSTGRFNRMIDTLNVVDPLVDIKPKWAINQEIMNKSSKIRKDLLNELEEKERERVNKDGCDDFDDELKQTIRDECRKEYVETKIISQEILDAELNKWINYI